MGYERFFNLLDGPYTLSSCQTTVTTGLDEDARSCRIVDLETFDPLKGQLSNTQLKILASFTCGWCGAVNNDQPCTINTEGESEAYGSPHIVHEVTRYLWTRRLHGDGSQS